MYSFTNGINGEAPIGGLVQDAAGVVYGTTSNGGDPSCKKNCTDFGTVFSLSRASGLKTLVYFTGPNGRGGSGSALLLSGTTLYGSSGGGASNDGVIFSVKTDGSGFTLLHQFIGTDGMLPQGTPRLGAGGILYGIANLGGAFGNGVLFSIAPDGTYTVLHVFTGGTDGGQPNSLLMSATGELFGSTRLGGATASCFAPEGCGVMFSYTPSTATFANEYTFSNQSGGFPLLGSIGPGPTVYGVTAVLPYNGIYMDNVFAIGPSGFSTVVTLSGNEAGAGDQLYPGPTLAPNGSLLLTVPPSQYGGSGYLGEIKGGALAGSVDFNQGATGGNPTGQPLLGTSGTVYGTTSAYGKCMDCGTIYQVTQ